MRDILFCGTVVTLVWLYLRHLEILAKLSSEDNNKIHLTQDLSNAVQGEHGASD